MKRFLNSITMRLASLLTVLFLTVGFLPTAYACAADGSNPEANSAIEANSTAIAAQLSCLLRSSNPDLRDAALSDVINLALNSEGKTGPYQIMSTTSVVTVPDGMEVTPSDLRILAPDLLKVFASDRVENHRIMAAAALYAIGDEASMDALVRLTGEESSPRVRKISQRHLVAYYLGAYPELREDAERSGRLTLAQIEKAQRNKARLAKKAVAIK